VALLTCVIISALSVVRVHTVAWETRRGKCLHLLSRSSSRRRLAFRAANLGEEPSTRRPGYVYSAIGLALLLWGVLRESEEKIQLLRLALRAEFRSTLGAGLRGARGRMCGRRADR
jgi:hypothetical protein